MVQDASIQEHLKVIEYNLALNQKGRAQLLTRGQESSTPTEDWLDAISDEDDFSILYYFLRKNPSLCSPKIPVKPKAERKRKRKRAARLTKRKNPKRKASSNVALTASS